MSGIVSDHGCLIRGEINLQSIIKATQGGNNLSCTDARQELQDKQDTRSHIHYLYIWKMFGNLDNPPTCPTWPVCTFLINLLLLNNQDRAAVVRAI